MYVVASLTSALTALASFAFLLMAAVEHLQKQPAALYTTTSWGLGVIALLAAILGQCVRMADATEVRQSPTPAEPLLPSLAPPPARFRQ